MIIKCTWQENGMKSPRLIQFSQRCWLKGKGKGSLARGREVGGLGRGERESQPERPAFLSIAVQKHTQASDWSISHL